MKILKIKIGLLSLLAILSVSVFLTSCEQEETLIETTEEHSEAILEKSDFMLPFGYDKLSTEEQDEYLNSLNDEDFDKLVESSKVATYFTHLGKEEILKSISKYGDIFNQTTLELYLTSSEVENFSSMDFSSNIELRGCGNWFDVGNPKWMCTRYINYVCHSIKCKQKQKKICDYWFDKYRFVGANGC